MTKHGKLIRRNILLVDDLQMKRVAKMLHSVRDLDFRLWCFGSSVGDSCNVFSDLDLCVDTKVPDNVYYNEIFNRLVKGYLNKECFNNRMDIVYYKRLEPGSFVLDAIADHGVLLKDYKELCE